MTRRRANTDTISAEAFIAAWIEHDRAADVARALGCSRQWVANFATILRKAGVAVPKKRAPGRPPRRLDPVALNALIAELTK